MALLNQLKNFAKVQLSQGYNSAATSVVLVAGQGALLPSGTPYNLVWWDATLYVDPSDDPNVEIVRNTNISTDTLTITRAQEGTAASNHNTSGHVYKMIAGLTAKGPESLQIGSGANANASNLLDIRGNPTAAGNVHFVTTDADTGSYMTAVAGGNNVWCAGAVYDGTNFTARETTASVFQLNASTGIMKYFRDSALTPGNTYTPTIRFMVDGSGNIGALGATPAVALDAGLGSIATRIQALTLVNGANQNVAIGTSGLQRTTGPSGGFSIGGMTGGVDGRRVTILNPTAQVMTINNSDAGSSAGNKITTQTGGNVACGTNGGTADFVFSATDNIWILISHQGA